MNILVKGDSLNRNIALDILKLFLAFMVVGLHVGFLSDITLIGGMLTVNGIFRIAVPIFLLINGFYFYTIFIQKKSLNWFKRVLYLYLFWMLFYLYFWFSPSLLWMVRELFIGYYHLWYLPAMMGAAIMVILLNKKRVWLMILAILITFTVGVIIQYAGNYHIVNNPFIDKLFNNNVVHRNFLFFGFPFFGIGFLINKFSIHEKVSLRLSVWLSIVGLVLLIGESYFNYIAPSRDGGFDNFMSLLIVCPATFLLFMNINIKGKSKELALYSTGIYFVHILFFNVYHHYFNCLGGTTLTFIVILSSIITSYFLIKVNKKLKFIL